MAAASWYSPQRVLEKGLEFVGVDWKGRPIEANRKTFTAHYGRNEIVLSAVWYDICDLRAQMLQSTAVAFTSGIGLT